MQKLISRIISLTSVKIFLNLLNRALVFLHLDSNLSIVNFWRKRGENVSFSNIKIDGFENCQLHENHVLDWQKYDLKNNLSKYLHSQKRAFILDYGCGTGRYLNYLSKYTQFYFLGLDISASILKNFTQEKFKKNKKIKLVKLDLSQNQKFAYHFAGKFDATYSISVVQYIKARRLEFFLKNIYRLLKPGGIFYLQFANANDQWDRYLTLNYLRYFPQEMILKLQNSNFKILDHYSVWQQSKFEKETPPNIKNYGYVILASKPVLTSKKGCN